MPNVMRWALTLLVLAVFLIALDWVSRWILRAREWQRIQAALREQTNAAHETWRFGQTRKEPLERKAGQYLRVEQNWIHHRPGTEQPRPGPDDQGAA